MLGLHGGRAENGELQAMCEMRGIPFTGSGSASSHLAFDKVAAKRFAAIAGVKAPAGVALEDIEAAFAEYGKLIAKPARDGSSYGLIFVNAKQDLVAVRNAAKTEEYLIEPFIAGVEATCGVLEQSDGSLIALPPIEIIPAEGAFDYRAKYLAKATQEICPGRFSPEISAQIMDQALRAHRALSCSGYSRSDFIVSEKGPVYLETNTLPGLTKASLYPKALKAQGIEFADFLHDQIALAAKRAQRVAGSRDQTRQRARRRVGPVPSVKMLRLPGKVLRRRIKSRPARTDFTLCLPGSPKVNAGGACGAWLPGRELLRISASTTASREQVASSALRSTPSPA